MPKTPEQTPASQDPEQAPKEPHSEKWHREKARYHSSEERRLRMKRLNEEIYQHAVRIWTVNKLWDRERGVFVSQTPKGKLLQTIEQAQALYNPHHPAGARVIKFLETFRNK